MVIFFKCKILWRIFLMEKSSNLNPPPPPQKNSLNFLMFPNVTFHLESFFTNILVPTLGMWSSFWKIHLRQCIVSVSHTQNQAQLRTLRNVERGALCLIEIEVYSVSWKEGMTWTVEPIKCTIDTLWSQVKTVNIQQKKNPSNYGLAVV